MMFPGGLLLLLIFQIFTAGPTEANVTAPEVSSTPSLPPTAATTQTLTIDSISTVTSAQSVQFSCGPIVCDVGMDCISVNGSFHCADPCQHHTELHDEWRSTENMSPANVMCDRNINWQGWYQLFLGQTSARIPERCVAENRCGTHAPLFITTPHPTQPGHIELRTVCNAWTGSCCRFPSHVIHVKLCPGGHYVYRLIQPSVCHLAYCAEVNVTAPEVSSTPSLPPTAATTQTLTTDIISTVTSAQSVQFSCGPIVCDVGMDCISVNGSFHCADPCQHHTELHDEWRSTENMSPANVMCDRNINWQGWYQLFLGQTSARIPERCVAENRCGTHAPLFITTPHPTQPGHIELRTVCNAWTGSCCRFPSHIIHVKLCPGGHYVYRLIQPSVCHLAYCAEVNVTAPEVSSTPSLPPTAATTQTLTTDIISTVTSAQSVQFSCGPIVCDVGMDCISVNGSFHCADPCQHHTELHDEWRSTENMSPANVMCDRNINWQGWYQLFLGQTSARIPERCVAENRCGTHAPLFITTPHPTQPGHIELRTVCNAWTGSCCRFPSHVIHVKLCPGGHYVYRLIQPSACHLAYCAEANVTAPEVSSTPSLPPTAATTQTLTTDSISTVTSSQSVQFSCGPIVCDVGMDCISVNGSFHCVDPCQHHTELHDEWRSTENMSPANVMCDRNINWQGWYQLFLGQTSARIPERCVAENRCGTHAPLFITTPHPTQPGHIELRTVCNAWTGSCCRFPSHVIHVKLCPGGHYVYRLIQPSVCHLAYCAEVNVTAPEVSSTPSLPPTAATTQTLTTDSISTVTSSQSVQFSCGPIVCDVGMDCISVNGSFHCADPCQHHTELHDEWRSTENMSPANVMCDRNINWQGWYQLFLGQTSARIPERCVAENRCGTHAPLFITTPHPTQPGHIELRTVCNAWTGSCCRFPSHVIHVKLCPGGHYVYRLIQPSVCHLAYCAEVNVTAPEVSSTPSLPPTAATTQTLTTDSISTVTSSQSVQFSCGPIVCDVGMDCISVNGSFHCADPCQHHTELHDEWRSTENMSPANVMCDRNINWQGWYQLFLGQTSARIPERCVAENRCGTHAPLFITTPHPTQPGHIELRTVCNAWTGSCCRFPSHVIHVKLCPGGHYVYRLIQPSVCHLAYCAEANVTAPEVSSTPSLPPTAATTQTSTTARRLHNYQLICSPDKLQLGLDIVDPTSGLDALSGNLASHNCTRSRMSNGVVWYEVDALEGVCGNTLTINNTHAIYSNTLFLYPNSSEFNPNPVSIPFSCAYPLDADSSLDVVINPVLPTPGARSGIKGSGAEATTTMSLFRDSTFTQTYPAGRVTLPLGSPLYVGVSVTGRDPRFVVVLEDCYATPSHFPQDPRRDLFIHNKCPTNVRQVSVIKSGRSQRARFAALLFVEGEEHSDIYLHCNLSLCDRRGALCIPFCPRRAARSLSSSADMESVSIGPISWQKSKE